MGSYFPRFSSSSCQNVMDSRPVAKAQLCFCHSVPNLQTENNCVLCFAFNKLRWWILTFLTTIILFLSCIEITCSSSNSDFISIKQAHDGAVVRKDYKPHLEKIINISWLRAHDGLRTCSVQLPQLIWWNRTASIRFERWLQQCIKKDQTRTTFQSQ